MGKVIKKSRIIG